jgi:hypothetical protein
MVLSETGLGGLDWNRLAQDRERWRVVVSAVSAVMNLRVLAPRTYLVTMVEIFTHHLVPILAQNN